MRFPTLILLVVSALPFACVAQTEPSASQSSPLTECSGIYQCEWPSVGPLKTELYREGGRCLLGGRPLAPDGSSPFEDHIGSWKGTAKEFDICHEGDTDCGHCKRIEPEPSHRSSARCTGSPDACSSNGPGYCFRIQGCRMATYAGYDGSYDNYCTGSPDRCDTISSEDACTRQGCDWK